MRPSIIHSGLINYCFTNAAANAKHHTYTCTSDALALKALKGLIQTKITKLLFFEIIINVLVSCSRFIWIPTLWVYGHYKYFTLLVRGSTLGVRRHNLMSKVGPSPERVTISLLFYERGSQHKLTATHPFLICLHVVRIDDKFLPLTKKISILTTMIFQEKN